MGDMTPAKKALIAAAQAYYDEVAAATKDARSKLTLKDPDESNVVVAQNVVRTALEACYERMIPFGSHACMTMALRTASYALSAAPLDEQAHLVSTFMHSFPTAHVDRLKRGVIIRTGWKGEGTAPEGVTKQ